MAGDLVPPYVRSAARVSIHARAWRATAEAPEGMHLRGFNSRPRMAGDDCLEVLWSWSRFQFTPAHGGRRNQQFYL